VAAPEVDSLGSAEEDAIPTYARAAPPLLSPGGKSLGPGELEQAQKDAAYFGSDPPPLGPLLPNGVPTGTRPRVELEVNFGEDDYNKHNDNCRKLYAEPGVLLLAIKVTLDHQFKEKHRQHLERYASVRQSAGASAKQAGEASIRHLKSQASSLRLSAGGNSSRGNASATGRHIFSAPWRRKTTKGKAGR
jgi:hypothetical protein